MNAIDMSPPSPVDTGLAHFPRADGSPTPYGVFTSPAIYELEQERIFRGPWSFLGVEAEIGRAFDLVMAKPRRQQTQSGAA